MTSLELLRGHSSIRSTSGAVVRALALGLLLLGLVASPASARLFGAETFTLENGMQVVVVPNHRAPVVFHMVWYRVGAADEPVGKSGLAHFLEHLMFKGTETVAAGEFSKIVARNGGTDNAFTSWDYTAYFEKIARDRLELVMRLEADRMVNLALSDEVVLPEREVVLEERRSQTDNEPAARFIEQMNAVQFLAHPYGKPIVGWGHELEKLTTADAIAFYRSHYAPDNAILVVIGDVTAEELRPLAETYYGPIPSRPVEARRRPQEPAQVAARRVEFRDPAVRQPEWTRSYLAPSHDGGDGEHAYPLSVLAEILGGSTGRIYRSLVVERKLAAFTSVYYDETTLDPSRFIFRAVPLPGVALEELEAAMGAEIAKLLSEGVSEDEVARAKKRMVAQAIYTSDSLYGMGRVFGTALTAGLTVEDVETWPDRIAEVTVERVNAAARVVLRPGASVTGYLLPGDEE